MSRFVGTVTYSNQEASQAVLSRKKRLLPLREFEAILRTATH